MPLLSKQQLTRLSCFMGPPLCVAGIFLAVSPAEAESPEPAARLAQVVAELNQVRREQNEQRAKVEAERAQREAELRALQSELARKRSTRRPQEQTETNPADEADATSREHGARAFDYRQVLRVAEQALKSARTEVDRGIGAEREQRLEQLDAIAAKLRATESDLQGALLAVPELMNWFGDELNLGANIELQNTQVLLDGGQRKVHAHVLRLGLLAEAFVSEDGRDVGFRPHGADDYDTALPAEQRQALEEAVRILRRKSEPKLVALPLGPLEPSEAAK